MMSCRRLRPFSRGVTCQRQLAKSSEDSSIAFSIHCVSGEAVSMKKPPSGARRRTDMALVTITSC